MSRDNRSIDYLDLDLELPSHSLEAFKCGLDMFTNHHNFVQSNPRLNKTRLLINSYDFVAYAGYLDIKQISDFDMHRFLIRATQALEHKLLNATVLDHRAHYQWCLTALKNFEIGRFL